MIKAAILQLFIFTSYIAGVVYFYGVQKSISESWYVIKHEYLFTLFCVSVGFLNCLHGNEWFFLGGTGLCFVGAAAQFKGWSVTKTVHYTGAVCAIAFSIIGLNNYYLLIPIILTAAFIRTNRLWWIEVVAFYSIIIAIMIKVLGE